MDRRLAWLAWLAWLVGPGRAKIRMVRCNMLQCSMAGSQGLALAVSVMASFVNNFYF